MWRPPSAVCRCWLLTSTPLRQLQEPAGFIKIVEYDCCEPCGEAEGKKHKGMFTLRNQYDTDSRAYYFYADTEEDMNAWVADIGKVMHNLHEGTGARVITGTSQMAMLEEMRAKSTVRADFLEDLSKRELGQVVPKTSSGSSTDLIVPAEKDEQEESPTAAAVHVTAPDDSSSDGGLLPPSDSAHGSNPDSGAAEEKESKETPIPAPRRRVASFTDRHSATPSSMTTDTTDLPLSSGVSSEKDAVGASMKSVAESTAAADAPSTEGAVAPKPQKDAPQSAPKPSQTPTPLPRARPKSVTLKAGQDASTAPVGGTRSETEGDGADNAAASAKPRIPTFLPNVQKPAASAAPVPVPRSNAHPPVGGVALPLPGGLLPLRPPASASGTTGVPAFGAEKPSRAQPADASALAVVGSTQPLEHVTKSRPPPAKNRHPPTRRGYLETKMANTSETADEEDFTESSDAEKRHGGEPSGTAAASTPKAPSAVPVPAPRKVLPDLPKKPQVTPKPVPPPKRDVPAKPAVQPKPGVAAKPVPAPDAAGGADLHAATEPGTSGPLAAKQEQLSAERKRLDDDWRSLREAQRKLEQATRDLEQQKLQVEMDRAELAVAKATLLKEQMQLAQDRRQFSQEKADFEEAKRAHERA